MVFADRKIIGEPLPPHEAENARKLVGEKIGRVLPSRINGEYGGKALYMTETHLIQQVGKATVIAHDLSKLENGDQMGKLYDDGKLTNKVLKIQYGEERGNAEILPYNMQRAAEIKKQATQMADKAMKNDLTRDPCFKKHVDRFTKDMVQPAQQKQAALLEKSPPQKSTPAPAEKVR